MTRVLLLGYNDHPLDDSMPEEYPHNLIWNVGIGTFFILLCGFIYIFSCFAGCYLMRHPTRLLFVSTSLYVFLITFLMTAKRRSRWVKTNIYENVPNTDYMWLIRPCFGSLLLITFCTSIFLFIKQHLLSIVSARDLRRLPTYRESYLQPS